MSDSEEVGSTARKSAWARLLARVYEVDPLVCPECGSPMVTTQVPAFFERAADGTGTNQFHHEAV